MDRTFWFLVLTTLGPAFVLPRAVTVAYEMGIKPFYHGNGLMLFSVLFCLLTLIFALKPGKLVSYIGKVMTPALIVMLAVLVIAALINPLGSPTDANAVYKAAPTVNGMIRLHDIRCYRSGRICWVIIQTIRSTGIAVIKRFLTIHYALQVSTHYRCLCVI